MNSRTRSRLYWASVLLVAASTMVACSVLGGKTPADMKAVTLRTVIPDRTYDVPMEECKKAALHALEQAGIPVVEEGEVSPDTWYCIGEVGPTWASNGEFLRVAMKPVSLRPLVNGAPAVEAHFGTEVYYDSIRRFAANVTEDLAVVRQNILSYMDAYIQSL